MFHLKDGRQRSTEIDHADPKQNETNTKDEIQTDAAAVLVCLSACLPQTTATGVQLKVTTPTQKTKQTLKTKLEHTPQQPRNAYWLRRQCSAESDHAGSQINKTKQRLRTKPKVRKGAAGHRNQFSTRPKQAEDGDSSSATPRRKERSLNKYAR